jgi:hypothetical protein
MGFACCAGSIDSHGSGSWRLLAWIWPFVLLGLGLIVISPEAVAQPPEQPQSPSYQVSGQVGWLLRYGLGDARGLSQKGYSSGLFFSQSIGLDADVSVPVERPIPGILSLIAQLDNQQPEFLQSLHMRWQARSWQVEFGDFPMGRADSPFASAERLLKGFKLDWQLSERLSVSGILSRVEGLKQSRTFRGNTVEETVTFAFRRAEQPWLEETYLRNLKGLEHFPLGGEYVEGFTQVKLALSPTTTLEELLQSYELGYLFEIIQGDPERELDPSFYIVIFTGEEYFLVLRDEFEALLRERLFEYIEDYNRKQGLRGEERKEYPFSAGTDYERGFLELLSDFVELKVDSLSFKDEEGARQRFYALGRRDIQEETVKIEVGIEGEFLDINDPQLIDYNYKIYPESGVIELDFPQEFYEDPKSAVRVTYSYQTGAGTYVLGLSVLKGSERVYLNGELLQPGIDYLLEYETGFLILFREIGSEDVLRIEYELARAGLGGLGLSDYRRSFQGVTLSYKPFEDLTLNFDLLRAYDSPMPGRNPETLETMPNTHTVLGVSGRWEGETTQGAFDLGLAVNRFPPDDNLKANLPNRINAIHALEHHGRELVLFGHLNGLLVYDGRDWSSYGPFEGLAGLVVHDIASAYGQVVFATSGGVSLLRLDPGDPLASFARRANWKGLAEEDGLPSSTAYAVLIEGDMLWVGTDRGLARAPLSSLDDEEGWQIYQTEEHPQLPSDRVLELAASEGLIYVGTDQGLAVFDPVVEAFQVVDELRGLHVNDLAVDGNVVYVATDSGVRALERGRGLGWPVADLEVTAVAVQGGELWYGTSEGLYGLIQGKIPESEGRTITALGASKGAIWAGEEATSEYELLLFRADFEGVRLYPQTETLLSGRAEGRFVDIPAAEHTDLGWLGRLVLTKEIGPIRLQGTLESISPQFSPVGAIERRDHLRLNISALYPISRELSLRAHHEEGLFELFGSPSQVVQDGIGLRFAPGSGPKIDLDYTIRRVNRDFEQAGFDRLRRSYSLSVISSFLDERLSVKLGYQLGQNEDLRRPRYSSLESELSGQLSLKALEGLTLRLGFRQPLRLRFDRWWGDHRIDWGADWSTTLMVERLPLSLQAKYQGNGLLPLAEGQGILDQGATLLVRASALEWGGLLLHPQISFSLRSNDLFGPNALLELGGEGTLQGSIAEFDARLYYKKNRISHERSRLERFQDLLRLNIGYNGFPQLSPTLEFSGSIETLVHPIFGRKRSGQYQISLQLLWQQGPLQADLYLSRQLISNEREQTVSYLLQQSLQYLLSPGLAPRLEFQVEYLKGQERGEPVDQLHGELSLIGGFTPIEEWGATLTVAYLFGLDAIDPRGGYHSFALTLEFGRSFALF